MSSSHTALIVDADPKGLEALVYGFQGATWRVTACPTPETASLLVKASGAKIILIASRADHEKAHTLIRQIRSKETFRTLPILVLGPEELRNAIKKQGNVDLLLLPTFVRDVLTASQLLVAAGAPATQKPAEEPCFATDITSITTLSLVRTMNGLARSGSLHLDRKGRHGEILFHEGELTAAQVGQLQGMAAVQHVLIWNDGALQLHLRPIARRGQLHQTAQEFIEEFDRFQRDFTHAIKEIGPTATVYAKNERLLLHSANAVPPEVTPVVRLCDEKRTLADILDESPFHVLDTVRILGRLVDLGILVRRDPKPLGDTTTARTPLEEFWETARIVGPPIPRASQTQARNGGTPAPVHASSAAAGQTERPAIPEPRSEAATRSKGDGRARKPTLEMISPTSLAPAAEPPPATAQPVAPKITPTPVNTPSASLAPTTPLSVTPKAPLSGSGTSGIMEIAKDARRTQPTLRMAVARPSVVVDIAQVEAVTAPKSPSVVIPVQPAPTINSAARITGEMQVAPSRKTVHPMRAAERITIQLDASFTAEQENATRVTKPADDLKIEPTGARITGEMQVTPSENSFRRTGRITNMLASFQIDPSLASETPVVPNDPGSRPRSNQPGVGPGVESSEKRHQTGNFSPIEKDFFAREAELYKEDKVESFADLEEKRVKQIAKTTTHGKGDRQNRK
jgi:hypothetical protein